MYKKKSDFQFFFFKMFGFFMPFWCKWQLALCIISDFLGIKNLGGLNDLNSLNNLSDLNDLYSLISSKTLYRKVKMCIFDGLLLYITWKRPLKVKIIQNSFRNKRRWLIEPKRSCNIKKIKTCELDINVPISILNLFRNYQYYNCTNKSIWTHCEISFRKQRFRTLKEKSFLHNISYRKYNMLLRIEIKNFGKI